MPVTTATANAGSAIGTIVNREQGQMKTHPDRRIVEVGPSVGTFRDRDIPEYVVTESGIRSDFIRIAKHDRDGCCDLSQLGSDECIISPGLVYRAR